MLRERPAVKDDRALTFISSVIAAGAEGVAAAHRRFGKLLSAVYEQLEKSFGYQGWWPLGSRAGTPGHDDEGYRTSPTVRENLDAEDRREIAIGAVLTQNTAWENARSALAILRVRGLLKANAIKTLDPAELAAAIRSSGYYNQKARKIRGVVAFLDGKLIEDTSSRPSREELLGLWGIGPETADSILLYAFGSPQFIVDAYARRIFARIGLCAATASYSEIQTICHGAFPGDAEAYGELHALLVRHGQRYCRRRLPRCAGCPVRLLCSYAGGSPES